MDATIVTALITSSGAILLAGASYWFTKKREREAELRKEKLEHYKEFVSSFAGAFLGSGTQEGRRAFSRASTNLNLIASQSVLKALNNLQRELSVNNKNHSVERHNQLLSQLFYEMRKDLRISPKDKKEFLEIGLWSAGSPPDA